VIHPKRIHEFAPLGSSEITADTVFEVEKPTGGDFFLLLESGDDLLLESGDPLKLEGTDLKFSNYKVTYADLLARIISDMES